MPTVLLTRKSPLRLGRHDNASCTHFIIISYTCETDSLIYLPFRFRDIISWRYKLSGINRFILLATGALDGSAAPPRCRRRRLERAVTTDAKYSSLPTPFGPRVVSVYTRFFAFRPVRFHGRCASWRRTAASTAPCLSREPTASLSPVGKSYARRQKARNRDG